MKLVTVGHLVSWKRVDTVVEAGPDTIWAILNIGQTTLDGIPMSNGLKAASQRVRQSHACVMNAVIRSCGGLTHETTQPI